MIMIPRTKTKYGLVILFILLWLFAGNSLVLSARLAGENGATSVTSKTDQESQAPAQPSTKKWPNRRPAQRTIKTNNKAPAEKAPKTKKTENAINVDYNNVDIMMFIQAVSEQTGKNFVVDKGVSGKVTVISPTKISKQELYKVFESVLEVHGYATVPAGSIIKIVPAATAKSKNIETRLRKEAISLEDKIITQLIPLKYANPSDLKKLFDPFISKSSLIVPYAPTGPLTRAVLYLMS